MRMRSRPGVLGRASSSSANARIVSSIQSRDSPSSSGGARDSCRAATGDRQLCVADGLGRGDGGGRETPKPPEEPLFVLRQEVVRPGDGRPERPLPRIGVPPALEIEPLAESLEQLARPEELKARRRELDGKGEPIEPIDERVHRRVVLEVDGERVRARDSRSIAPWSSASTGYSRSPSIDSRSRLVARTVEVGQAATELRERDGRLREEVLDVVDHEEGTLPRKRPGYGPHP